MPYYHYTHGVVAVFKQPSAVSAHAYLLPNTGETRQYCAGKKYMYTDMPH